MARRRNTYELYDLSHDRVLWRGELDEFMAATQGLWSADEAEALAWLSHDHVKGAYFVDGEELVVLRRAEGSVEFAAVVASDDEVVVLEGMVLQVPNRCSNPCKKGEILISRRGYRRGRYTRSDGVRVKATRVPAASFCVPDPGRKGRRARGAKKGPYRKEAPWIQREGELGGPGFTKKSTPTRRRLMGKCVREYGYRSCLGKIMVLLKNSDIKPTTRRVLEADKAWLMRTYGGPGSFAQRNATTSPSWGEPYGPGPHYQTTDGRLVTMFRKGQKVRFYDQEGHQVGPEQSNVAPAIAYAQHNRWRSITTRMARNPTSPALSRFPFFRTGDWIIVGWLDFGEVPSAMVWQRRGSSRQVVAAHQFVEREHPQTGQVFIFPKSERDPLGRAREQLLARLDPAVIEDAVTWYWMTPNQRSTTRAQGTLDRLHAAGAVELRGSQYGHEWKLKPHFEAAAKAELRRRGTLRNPSVDDPRSQRIANRLGRGG